MKRLALLLSLLSLLGCSSDDAEGSGTGGTASGGAGGAGGSGGTLASGGAGGTLPSGGAGGGTSGSGGSSGDAGADCLAKAQGLGVANVDLDGFPSYSVSGCELAYVSASTKELLLKELTTGTETLIAPAAESPRRPSLAGGVLAWEADVSGKSVVRVRHAGQITTLSGSFDHAGEPRATADAVVFTGWLGPSADGDTDVFLFTPNDSNVKLVLGGKGQQRFADVSSTHVAVSDFSEDPNGYYGGDGTTLADVVVVERAGGATTAKKGPGKQAFPMLGSAGTLAYLEWITVHPVPKLQQYTILAVPLATLTAPALKIADVQSEQAVRPTAAAGVAEWVERWGGQNTLYRAALDGSAAPVKQNLGTAAVLHAPSSSSSMTVLAVEQTAGSAPALLAIPR